MKNILATTLLTSFGLLAQTAPAQTDAVNTAASASGAKPVELAQANQPAFPAFPTPPPRRFPRGAGATTNSAGNANPLSGLPGTNGAATAAAGQSTNAQSDVAQRVGAAVAGTGTGGKPEHIFPPGEIDFPNIGVDQVLEVYGQLVQRTVLHAQLPAATISLKTETPLTTSEVVQALNSVLAMNGITMINVEDKFVKAVAQPQAPMQGQVFNTRNPSELPEDDEYVTQIVQLKYIKPKEIIGALAPLANMQNGLLPIDDNQILIIRDYSPNVKRMMELIKQIDVNVPLDYESEVIPIKYAQAQDIANALSSLGGGTGTSIGKGSNVGHGSTGTMGGIGGGIGGAGGVGGYGAGGLGTGTTGAFGSTGIGQQSPYGSTSAAGGSRTASFGDRLSNLVSKAAHAGEFQVLGETKIIADQRTNSLLVFANKTDMKMIKEIIKKLDIVLAQVLIEAIIMEVNLDNSHNIGFSYLQVHPTTAGPSFSGIGALNNGTILSGNSFQPPSGTNAIALPGGFSYLANLGNNFQATVTAVAADSRINVLSRPRIQTSHGVPATIQVGQSVPEITGTYFGGINGAASSQYQQQFVGIQLQVTPLINPDGLVVMDISQQVQQLGPNFTIDGNQVPSTTQRNAQATVSVRDRDTIILGGMISTTVNSSHSGVPVLKDIPVLGYLFRTTSVDKQRVELIVLIHPTVLPTPESAALVATHERNQLPGVRAAEAEERKDANDRLKDAEKIKVPDELE